MLVRSSLLLNKVGETGSILTDLWNNLARAMVIMNEGKRLPSTMVVPYSDMPLRHQTYDFDLRLYRPFALPWINVVFLYDSQFDKRPEENLNTAVAMTSAMEYVIGRTECFDIDSWKVFYGTTEKENRDVGVDSMADVLGVSKEDATALFEERVATKLDEIEKVCF